jgi:signal peptidase II
MRTSRACALALLACVMALVGCDHATKLAAESALRDGASVAVVPRVLDLAYRENRDVAFNVFERLSWHPPAWTLLLFAALATIGIVGAWVRRRERASAMEHAGFALVVSGAAGNGIDRAVRGHVVDFIHLRSWPVFNVADVLVVVGIGLLAVASSLKRRGSRRTRSFP